MSNNPKWWAEIEDKYRNIFATRMKKALPDYDIRFPTESDNKTPTHFPTVYFSEISQTETGNDLENDGINAVMESIEVEVVTNDDKAELKDITAVATIQMKNLRFNAVSLPVYLQEGENVRRSVARYRRLIGADDTV